MQAFEPRFFEVCPQCNKRVRLREEGFFCEEHNIVAPNYSYVLNLVLDDGTETVRTVFFRKQAENLLGMSHEQILEYKDAPERFEEVKNSLIGNIVKVVGRANKNELFDRIEFVTRLVFPKPDPQEEIERLKKDAESKKPEKETKAADGGIEELSDKLPTVEEI